MLLSSLCVFCPEMLTSEMISSCFTTCLYNRYLKDHLHCLFMFSPVTRYHSVTRLKSDVTAPVQPSTLSLSLLLFWGGGGTVAWWSAFAVLWYSALRQLTRSTLFLCVPSRIAAALLYNDQLRIGALWRCVAVRHLLLSSCKIPSSHGFVYAWAFSYRTREEKRMQTHKLCPNDNKGNAITGNTFITSPLH